MERLNPHAQPVDAGLEPCIQSFGIDVVRVGFQRDLCGSGDVISTLISFNRRLISRVSGYSAFRPEIDRFHRKRRLANEIIQPDFFDQRLYEPLFYPAKWRNENCNRCRPGDRRVYGYKCPPKGCRFTFCESDTYLNDCVLPSKLVQTACLFAFLPGSGIPAGSTRHAGWKKSRC